MSAIGSRDGSRLAERVAIVTGAARGIGLAASRALAEAGARVLLADLDDEIAGEEARRLTDDGWPAAACRVDVAEPESARRMVQAAVDRWGRIDVVVNNAGIAPATPFASLDERTWQRVLSVNLSGALHVTKAAFPHLERSPAASIINVASTQGLRGQPDAAAYGASKGGVVNLTRCLAVDFGPFGIRANAVAPGFIDTRLALLPDGAGHEHRTQWFQDIYIKHGRLPLRRAGIPEDVAGPIVFLAGDDSRYVTGQILVVDGGFMCTY